MNMSYKSNVHTFTRTGLFLITFVWLVGLVAVSFFADTFLPYKPSFPYSDSVLPDSGLSRWLYSFANFDGVHYLTIADRGYVAALLIQAFFPLFPLLISGIGIFFGGSLQGGLILNWLLIPVMLYLLQALLRIRLPSTQIRATLVWVLLFPTSFFFAALYTETLFMTLLLASFLFAEQKRWKLAVLCAALLTATRLVGAFIVPALMVLSLTQQFGEEALLRVRITQRTVVALLVLLLGFSGLFGYMFYLQKTFSDPLLFVHVQSQFGSGRQDSLVLLPQTLWRGIKIVATVPLSLKWWSYLQDLVMTTIALCLLAIGVFRTQFVQKFFGTASRHLFVQVPQLPLSWYVFAVPAVLLPTASGTLSSMSRYVLVAFPIFVILACSIGPKWLKILCYLISGIALVFNLLLFVQGYWVA